MTATAPNDIARRLEQAKYEDEAAALRRLLTQCPLTAQQREQIGAEARTLVEAVRADRRARAGVEQFLHQFPLDTREGLALMCLAEALLRTPDAATRDALIREKIGAARWRTQREETGGALVALSGRALQFAAELVGRREKTGDAASLVRRVAGRLGEPLVRRALLGAVEQMGAQFVLGRDIEHALRRARREHLVCSFDMLGEGARTEADAARFEQLYGDAIAAVGRTHTAAMPESGHGISVKLSALLPRYRGTQVARAWSELYPRLERLARLAASFHLNLTVDAEETEQLALSLQLFERLARELPADWSGLGLVVQAYQKNAPVIIDWLAQLARHSGRRLMVRLVKGAYWDSEIKRAQVAGVAGYPVFTRKAATDLSYLVCANRLLAAAPHLYAQFATHNAHTLAAVRQLAAHSGAAVEYQRLHGMGTALYRHAARHYGALPLRVYAPVGGHRELLPYLVRRLLENGANASFVHALLDTKQSAATAVADPIAAIEADATPHPAIALPQDLFGAQRKNSAGRDLTLPSTLDAFAAALRELDANPINAAPIVAATEAVIGAATPVLSPADHSRIVGHVRTATDADIDAAFARAQAAQPAWDRRGGDGRARILEAMAQGLEQHLEALVALLAREAGKTFEDGIGEVREAVDFCRYYAGRAREQFQLQPLPGPTGEYNALELHGRGVFACISPWNFPLSIFTGQIAAALAAGNAVLAKPAEQTPLIAARAVQLFHACGLPPELLALLPGPGETVGAALCADARLAGVAFTGGTETARRINRALAGREGPIVPFIAETGGLNGLFADSTALPEQLVDDVLGSAFGAAGQRCSALRVLFLPEQTADDLIARLIGALDTLTIGDPADPNVEVGPVIDNEARAALQRHIVRLEQHARILYRKPIGDLADRGSFFGPVIAEIPTPDFLDNEVFGPILHIHRYRDVEVAAARFAARGFGLTLGVHSRIDDFARRIRTLVPAGNSYVNRSMIGAVVGVQPFGGEGLSGTGPKAGGPNTLLRYAVERSVAINTSAQGGDAALLNLGG